MRMHVFTSRPLAVVPGLFALLFVFGVSCASAQDGVDGEQSAAAEIARWAKIKKADGPEGRPLPLTASWVPGKMFGMKALVEMIKDGHHVLPTMGDPKFGAIYHYLLQDREGPPTSDSHHLGWLANLEPEFEYLRKHDLPFALMGNNWAAGIASLERQYQRDANKHNRKEFSPEESARLMVRRDGEITSGSWKLASPFAPDESWKRFARWWMGNGGIDWVQEVYPDPPMVVWLNNNEAGEIGLKHLGRSVRFQREYGDQDLSKKEKQRLLHKAYDDKYAVLFEEARATMSKSAWKEHSVFVAYNAWPRSVEGRTPERNHPSEWKRYDGTMPEFYLNDWQIYRGKTDYNYWSPQTEGLRIQSSQDVIFDLDADHYFASIAWDGGTPASRRSAINSMATGMYGSGAVQRWDVPRYQGMVQFGLWSMRPRVMREFRYPVSNEDAYDRATFMSIVRSVDRVWNNATLKEFWRFGDLVKSEAFRPANQRVARELRFYSRVDALLPVDVNPDRKGWPRIWHFKANKRPPVKLRVMAMALKLGEKPDRRWLVYAHAPLGAVSAPKVTIPDYQQIELPQVARSGSFFLVREGDDVAQTLIPGGPAELDLTVSQRFVEPGQPVNVKASVAFAPEGGFESFEWTLGKTSPQQTDRLGTRQARFTRPGLHMLRVTGKTEAGQTITADAPLFVGEKPGQPVLYDVALRDASAWRGPWKRDPKNPDELVTYRMVPNPGHLPDIVLHGGAFVHDEDLDRRVLELTQDYEGLWGKRSRLTSGGNQPNLTISLRFKAKSLDGTQVLYVQGGRGKGFNIYLHEGKLYAGSMSGKLDWSKFADNALGAGNGHWMSTDQVTAGQWHHVSLVLEDATKQVQAGKLSLYLDGKKVASAPGARIPDHHAGPRVGLARTTTLHTGDNIQGHALRGRLCDFQQINAARSP